MSMTRVASWRTREKSSTRRETRYTVARMKHHVLDLHALKDFDPDKRVRKMLFKTDQLWSEIACYEPGQSTVMHSHPREEEAIYVLEGSANMSINGDEVVVPAGAIVQFPANVPHDVRNLGRERCVIMFLKINPKVLKAGGAGAAG